MIVWEILVPRQLNDGTFVKLKHHRVWDEKVREIAGGLTVMVPTVKGEWIASDGNLFVDSTIPVRICCSREQIEKIMDMTAVHYQQKAILAYKVSDEVILKEYE